MAVTRLSLAVLLLFFVYCAVINEVKSTTILMDADYKNGRVLIVNDMNQFVTIEGPGLQLTEVPKTKKMSLVFKGLGMVTVKEDEKVILKTDVGASYLNLVRTHSNAYLMENLGDISISQRADQLNLSIWGYEDKKHTFALSENKSISKQMITVYGNSIAIKQASDQVNQNLVVLGAGENVFASTQDKPGENQSIAIRGRGPYFTSMSKDKGITIVSRKYRG